MTTVNLPTKRLRLLHELKLFHANELAKADYVKAMPIAKSFGKITKKLKKATQPKRQKQPKPVNLQFDFTQVPQEIINRKSIKRAKRKKKVKKLKRKRNK